MKNLSFLPTRDAERILWWDNFGKKFAIHGPNLQFTEAEIAEALKDNLYMLWFLQVWTPGVQNFAKEIVIHRNGLLSGKEEADTVLPVAPLFADAPEPRPPGLMPRLSTLVTQIKIAPGYNDTVIGQELRILFPVGTKISSREFPEFYLLLVQGPEHLEVHIIFKKHGHDGVVIECRINGGEWEFLAIDNAKPHIDQRPLLVLKTPEIRQYRLRFWDKGEANGIWSPAQSISVTV